MTKTVVQTIQNMALFELANFGETMHLNRLAPTTYHEAVKTVTDSTSGTALGKVTLTKSFGLGTYSLQNGSVSGRRATVVSQSAITLSETANANHLAIVSDTRSALLLVTTVTSQAVTAGNQAATSMFDLEVRDPT